LNKINICKNVLKRYSLDYEKEYFSTGVLSLVE